MKKPSKKLQAAIYLHAFNILCEEGMRFYRMHVDLVAKPKAIRRKKNGDIVIDVRKLNKKKRK